MDTQKYEVFIKAAELGSIKKAAEELGYTQAGLSYILRTLEKDEAIDSFLSGLPDIHKGSYPERSRRTIL